MLTEHCYKTMWIIKDVENGSFCCYIKCSPMIIRGGGMPCPRKDAKLGQRSSNQTVGVCWVLLNLIPQVFGQKKRDSSYEVSSELKVEYIMHWLKQ